MKTLPFPPLSEQQVIVWSGGVLVFDYQGKDWHEKNSSEFFESLFERAYQIKQQESV